MTDEQIVRAMAAMATIMSSSSSVDFDRQLEAATNLIAAAAGVELSDYRISALEALGSRQPSGRLRGGMKGSSGSSGSTGSPLGS